MAIQLRRRSKKRSLAGVSMAPMIDMVFLLLVFFMTASAMSQAGAKLELDLPESPSSEVPQDLSGRMIVSIDAEGQAFVGLSPLAEEELRVWMEGFREQQPNAKLRIRAARTTPFRAVKSVMRLAASSGVESYLYATYQAERQ